MSLRAEIHAAIDEVSPPAPLLASRVGTSLIAHDRVSQNRRRLAWTRPLRGMVGVLAAALVILIFAGLVLGGRLWRDWNGSPAGPIQISHAQLKALEARPLILPLLDTGVTCPVGPLLQTPRESGLGPLTYGDGRGPLYAEGTGDRFATSWGTYILTGYVVEPPFRGLMLIRARDLQTNQVVAFAHNPLLNDYYPAMPTGDMVGSDIVLERPVQLYTELAVQTENMYRAPGNWWPLAVTLQAFPKGSSGCIGFQVDGPSFTERFVVSY
jgi:hypothetical protein